MNAKPVGRPKQSPASARNRIALIGTTLALGVGAWAVAHVPLRPNGRGGGASLVTPLHGVLHAVATDDALAGIPTPAGTNVTDQAIAQGIQKARQSPEKDKIWVGLGDVLMQKARETADARYYGYAEKVYNQALALKPTNIDAMTGLAWVNGGRHQFDESIAWANKALALDPGNNTAYGLISDAEVERGEYDAAFEHTQKMIDLRPDLSSYSRGAYLLYVTGDNRKAQWLMAKAINAGSTFAENTAWCRTQLAQILFSDGNLFAANQIAADSLSKNPGNFHVLAMMAKIKAAKKDYAGAAELDKKALASSPDHLTLVALGDVYTAMGKKDEAAKTYAQVEALHAKNNVTGAAHDHMQMAQFYADHDLMPAEAVRLAEEHKMSKNVFEQDILAWAYYKNGQLPEAKDAIERAMSRHTADARFYYHAGMIYAKLGNPGVARLHLSHALSLNPNFSPLAAPLAVQTLQSLGRMTAQNRVPIPAIANPPAGSDVHSTTPNSVGIGTGRNTPTSANTPPREETPQGSAAPMPGATR